MTYFIFAPAPENYDWPGTIIQAALLVIAVLAIVIPLRAEVKRRRKEKALDILTGWNDIISKYRFEKQPTDWSIGCNSKFTRKEAEELLTNPKRRDDFREIAGRLNYLEYAASAYLNDVADKEILDHAIVPIIFKYMARLRNLFIVHAREMKRNPLPPVTILIDSIMSQQIKRQKSLKSKYCPFCNSSDCPFFMDKHHSPQSFKEMKSLIDELNNSKY